MLWGAVASCLSWKASKAENDEHSSVIFPIENNKSLGLEWEFALVSSPFGGRPIKYDLMGNGPTERGAPRGWRGTMQKKRIDISDVNDQSLLLCGFSVQTTAIFLAYYRPIQMDFAAVTSSVTAPVSIVFSVALALVLALLGVGHRRVAKALENLAVLALLGMAFVAAAIVDTSLPPDQPAFMAVDLVARVCSAALMIGWLRVFANFDSETVLKSLPAVMAFGLLVVLCAVAAGPAGRLPCLVVLCIVAVAWLYAAIRLTRSPAAVDTEASALSRGQSAGERRGALGKICGAALLLSLLLGVLCALPHLDGGSPTAGPFFLYFLSAMGVALLVLACMPLLRARGSLSVGELRLRAGFPVVLVIVFALAFVLLRPPLDPLLNALGRMCMELSLLVSFLLAARHFGTNAVKTFAFGQGAFLVGNMGGMALGLTVPPLFDVPTDQILVAGAAVLLLTSEAVFLLVVLYQFSQRITQRTATVAQQEEPSAAAKDEQLQGFASAFRLSEKEAEVLRLTVRGRSRQRIAEALYVSPGSVNTYFHRIYQKTEVHSRQELLDKIEEFQGEQHDGLREASDC